MAEVGRKIEIHAMTKPKLGDLKHLLKKGKLQEYILLKDERLKKWKEDRYRVCSSCGIKKLRVMYKGDAKYCNNCKSINKRSRGKALKDYHKVYIRTEGKDLWCAKQIVYNLKKMGILVKQHCISCGDANTFAHHKDYNKPWEVEWLCRRHHTEWHKNNEPIYVRK